MSADNAALASDNDTGAEECRACLKKLENEHLYNVFQAWSSEWDGMSSTIAEDLAQLADVQLKETDKHSKLICSACCSNLWNACKFKLLVKASDKILQQRYPEAETEVEKQWPQPIQVEKSVASIFNDPSQVVIKQEVLSDDENTGREEGYTSTNCLDMIKIEPEEITQPVTREPSSFRVTEMNGQECLEIEDDSSVDLETNQPIQDKARKCDGLKKKTEVGTKQMVPMTRTDVMEVVAEAMSKPVEILKPVKEEPLSDTEDVESAADLPRECLLCARRFCSLTGLKAHVIAQHSYQAVERRVVNDKIQNNNKYVCATCRRTFVTSTDLMVHETCHNKHICYGCGAKHDTFSQLARHRRRCKSRAPAGKLKTLQDVKRPSQEHNLVTEIKIEIANVTTLADCKDTLQCPHCPEVFSDPYYMRIHQEVQHVKQEPVDTVNGTIPMEIEALESIFTDEL